MNLPKTVTLFPRIEQVQLGQKSSETLLSKEISTPAKPEISEKMFQKIDLRVATVLHAEPVPRSKNLLKLKVNVGEERTIVAGIGDSYQAQELIGKHVVIVANLKPAKLMGILSQGMVLTASDNATCRLVTVDGSSEPGTPLT
jgi:methionyl-tRNA synthetase